MADINVAVGVSGKNEFRDAFAAMSAQAKALDAELKSVQAGFDTTTDAEEKAARAGPVLQKSIVATRQRMELLNAELTKQRSRLDELGAELEKTSSQYGKDSKEAAKAQRAYNRQVKAVADLEKNLNDARTSMSKFSKEMNDMGKEADDATENLGGVGTTLKSAFLGGGIAGAVSGIVQTVVGGIGQIIESTKEYNKIMASLEVSSRKAGYTNEQTAASYQQLYNIIGDEQQSATALANLQALGLSQQQLTQITDGAIGAWARYGDSIPIDGLAEGINETVQAGVATGYFADLLNWAGASEDDFNTKLAAAGSTAERANLILQEMANQGLIGMAETYRELNPEIVAANEAQSEMTDSTARLGEILMPLATQAKTALADVLDDIVSIVEAFQTGGVDAGFEKIGELASGLFDQLPSLEDIDSYLSEVGPGALAAGGEIIGNLLKGAIDAIPDLLAAMPDLISDIADFLANRIEDIPDFVAAGATILKKILQGLIENAPEIAAGMLNIRDAIQDGLINIMGAILQAGSDLVSWILQGIMEAGYNAGVAVGGWVMDNLILPIAQKIDDFKNAGLNLIHGLIDGIIQAGEEAITRVRGIVDNIKNVFTGKSGFDEHSPSVWAKQVGRYIMDGLSIGQKQGAKNVVKTTTGAVDDIKNAMESAVDAVNGEISARQAAEQQKQAENEKNEYLNSIREKYAAAEKLEGEERQSVLDEIAKLQADWDEKQAETAKKAEEEAWQARLDAVEEFRDEYTQKLEAITDDYEKSLEEIKNSQQEMADDLAGFGDLFQIESTDVGDVLQLGDLQPQIDAIYAYGDALESLKSRGIDAGLLAEIQGMDIDEATQYMDKLLDMTDTEYARYMDLWMQKQQAAQDVAAEFYQQEIDTLAADMLGQMQTFVSDFDQTGTYLMDGLAVGIQDGKSGVINAVRDALKDAVAEARSVLDIHSPSGVFSGIGENMAAGVGVGWTGQFRSVAGLISNNLQSVSTAPVPAAYDPVTGNGLFRALEGAIAGLAGADTGTGQGPITIILNLDGNQIAQAVFDPLKNVSRQRGVAIG